MGSCTFHSMPELYGETGTKEREKKGMMLAE